MATVIEAGPITLRSWREDDVADLVREANSRAVWRNLLDHFPHPYTEADAESWIASCIDQDDPQTKLVIAKDDHLIGGCGFDRGTGVSQYTGKVGYWLGEAHWGQGFATAMLERFVDYIWDTFDVQRLQAEVFEWNPASARVLEKSGFTLEGVRRMAIFKDGEFLDESFYSLLRDDLT